MLLYYSFIVFALATVLVGALVHYVLRLLGTARPVEAQPANTNTSAASLAPGESLPRNVSLKQVYPRSDDTETDIDVIAIHGLDTNSSDTWTWKFGQDDVSKTDNIYAGKWLEDLEMLPKDIGPARIFLCDWPADLLERSDYSQRTLSDFARSLLAGIQARPSATKRGKDRPILFLASCLGGVVLMKALVMADSEYLPIKQATRGVVFLATPFRGTSFLDIAAWAEPSLRTYAFSRGLKVSKLLNESNSTSELGDLVRDFTRLCRLNDLDDSLATFYETGTSSILRRVLPLLPLVLSRQKLLVDKDSATLQITPNPIALGRRHVLMNKFSGPEDKDYKLVATRIAGIVEKIRDGKPIEQADAHMRERHYTVSRLSIRRISGDTLSVAKCYLNLAIVEDHSGKQGAMDQNDTNIDMRSIFDQREKDDGTTIMPRRILIRGQAGIGKSTLCKKMVHEFKDDGLWSNLFDRILWIPLRNLKTLPTDRCNLRGLCAQEYFSQAKDPSRLAEVLSDQLEQESYGRTLFVLDGLDEVTEGFSEINKLHRLFETLFNMPAVVATTRPYVSTTDLFGRAFDLELETTGFYSDQVRLYMENVFTSSQTLETDVEKVESIQSTIEQHPSLQDLVRIPIQLDALCYLWGGSKSEQPTESALVTMTGVYHALVERLWTKDILRLQLKHSDGLPIEQEHLRHASLKRLESSMPDEAHILRTLAFTGMVNNQFSFPINDWKPLTEKLSLEDSSILPGRWLEHLSFWYTPNPSAENPAYQFLHITFQEYFAARYFVQQWKDKRPLLMNSKGEEDDAETFLAKNKYNTRYHIFWRFVAGLFNLEGPYFVSFMEAVEREPVDLIGPVHQRMLMRCLNEMQPSKDDALIDLRERIERQLEAWLVFEKKLQGRNWLAREKDMPFGPLQKYLQSFSPDERCAILEQLSENRRDLSSDFHDLLQAWKVDICNQDLEKNIMEILRNPQRRLSKQRLKAVVARLAHSWGPDGPGREELRLLRHFRSLDTDILDTLTGYLHVQDTERRKLVVKVFEGQLKLNAGHSAALAERLGKENGASGLAREIICVLGKSTRLTSDVLRSIAEHLKGHPMSPKDAATHTLITQSCPDSGVVRSILQWLRGSDRYNWEMYRVLVTWSEDNRQARDFISEQLLGGDSQTRQIVLQELFRNHNVRCETWESTIGHMLLRGNANLRLQVLEALRQHRGLSPGMVDMICAQLDNPNKQFHIKHAAITALAYQQQLDHRSIGPLKRILEFKHVRSSVSGDTLGMLMRHPEFSDYLHDHVLEGLHSYDPDYRSDILWGLVDLPQPGDDIVDAVALHLNSEGSFRTHGLVFQVLSYWPRLRPTVLDQIVEILKHEEEPGVIGRALRLLHKQPQSKGYIVQAVIQNLRHSSPYIQQEALEVFRSWPHLDQDILFAVSQLLCDAKYDPRFKPLQSVSKKELLYTPIHILFDGDTFLCEYEHVAHRAINVLTGQPSLDIYILSKLATCLEDPFWRVKMAAFYALGKKPHFPPELLEEHLESIYNISVLLSFREHIYWLTMKTKTFMYVGSKEICLRDSKWTPQWSIGQMGPDVQSQLHDFVGISHAFSVMGLLLNNRDI